MVIKTMQLRRIIIKVIVITRIIRHLTVIMSRL